MPAPHVSTIIPVRNGARFLRDALASALGQGDVRNEVLVIDDGSTDESRAIAASFGSRVTVVDGDGRGPGAARNRGIVAATGEFIAFLDADDRWHPGYLTAQLACLATSPDLAVSTCGWQMIDGDGQPLPQTGCMRREGSPLANLLMGWSLPPVAAVVRRTWLDRVGGFDATLAVNEDWDLFLRLSARGARWSIDDDLRVDYRVHAAQHHRDASRVHSARLTILERAFGDPDLPPALQNLRSMAEHRVFLYGAAEHVEQGAEMEARRLFIEGIRRNPRWLCETRSLRGYARNLLPLGRQCRAEVDRAWPEVWRVYGPLLRAAWSDPTIHTRGPVWRWRSHRALARAVWPIVRKRAVQRVRGRFAADPVPGQETVRA